LNHYNRANALRVPPGDVAFLATYSAKSGASSFNNTASLNCSNVSCHGGQATPNWQTGTIDVKTQCTSCHASGTGQFNSYNSGEHQEHVVGERLSCTVCHNTTTLAVNHFTGLATTTMEGPASATIGGAGTAIVSWNPTTKSCNPSCHETESWFGD
jgi:predicted CxxxxCH...CXXCH cytochrome family protein